MVLFVVGGMRRNKGRDKDRDGRSLYESVDESSRGSNMAISHINLARPAGSSLEKRGGAIRSMARARVVEASEAPNGSHARNSTDQCRVK